MSRSTDIVLGPNVEKLGDLDGNLVEELVSLCLCLGALERVPEACFWPIQSQDIWKEDKRDFSHHRFGEKVKKPVIVVEPLPHQYKRVERVFNNKRIVHGVFVGKVPGI